MTETDKDQYVDLVVAHRIVGRIAPQFRAFMERLRDVLPRDLLRVFDEHELELLIGGITEIDMDDWTRFTDYRRYEKTDRVIEWFWACLRSWPAERKTRLLQFTTGTSRVPVNGFKDLQGSDGPRWFTIEKSGGTLVAYRAAIRAIIGSTCRCMRATRARATRAVGANSAL